VEVPQSSFDAVFEKGVFLWEEVPQSSEVSRFPQSLEDVVFCLYLEDDEEPQSSLD